MSVLKKMGKKLKSNRGFTLVEMLVSLAIVVMLSLMMSYGVSVGASVQRESTFIAESDVLAATLNTALGDVLRYAEVREPKPGDDDVAKNEQNLITDVKTLLTNEDGTVTYLIDTDGYAIGGGAIHLDPYGGDATKKRLAVTQYVTYTESEDLDATPITEKKTYYLVSHGLYTNLEIMDDPGDDEHKFELKYIEKDGKKYFYAHYWIAEKNPSNPLKKEVETYFRVANE